MRVSNFEDYTIDFCDTPSLAKILETKCKVVLKYQMSLDPSKHICWYLF